LLVFNKENIQSGVLIKKRRKTKEKKMFALILGTILKKGGMKMF